MQNLHIFSCDFFAIATPKYNAYRPTGNLTPPKSSVERIIYRIIRRNIRFGSNSIP